MEPLDDHFPNIVNNTWASPTGEIHEGPMKHSAPNEGLFETIGREVVYMLDTPDRQMTTMRSSHGRVIEISRPTPGAALTVRQIECPSQKNS